eukprot:SAG11_NODE_4763_length_1776_cov_2.145498_2_plen_151_part_00
MTTGLGRVLLLDNTWSCATRSCAAPRRFRSTSSPSTSAPLASGVSSRARTLTVLCTRRSVISSNSSGTVCTSSTVRCRRQQRRPGHAAELCRAAVPTLPPSARRMRSRSGCERWRWRTPPSSWQRAAAVRALCSQLALSLCATQFEAASV